MRVAVTGGKPRCVNDNKKAQSKSSWMTKNRNNLECRKTSTKMVINEEGVGEVGMRSNIWFIMRSTQVKGLTEECWWLVASNQI